jgi:hypothetical protein
MNWIFDNFQILALIALAFASWLKHRMDTKAAEREERDAREQMSGPPDYEEPEEDWQIPEREYRPLVPPPLRPAQQPPPMPAVAQEAQAEAEAELQRQLQIQERLRQMRETKTVTTGGAAVTRARTAAKQSSPPTSAGTATTTGTGLRAALRNRPQIRRAVIMREILGPPLALRDRTADSSP